ncbi:MAG: hypothetical protein ACI9MB_001272, partial [Verrucomicrobiales bacterium]
MNQLSQIWAMAMAVAAGIRLLNIIAIVVVMAGALGNAKSNPEQALVALEAPAEIVAIVTDPSSITLGRPGERFTILVHGKTATGRSIDLTREAEYLSPASTDIVDITARGVVSGLGDGTCNVIVRARGFEKIVKVAVAGSKALRTFD